MNRNLESLLRWSIENTPTGQQQQQSTSTPNITELPAGSGEEPSTSASAVAAPSGSGSTAAGPVAPKKFDPEIIDAILGKSDADRMKEAVRDLQSDGFTEDQKLAIWDELELLVESLDNANDLENLKLWQPIFDFLSDPNEEYRIQACWVLGTAIQNNPRSQTAFLALDPLAKLLDILRNERSPELRSKTMYTLSGALRHHPPAVVRFTQLDGWSVLAEGLRDPSLGLRRKTAFLVNTLFINTLVEAEARAYASACQAAGLVDALIESLGKRTACPAGENGELDGLDQDYSEKALTALVTIVDKVGTKDKFSPDQLARLRELVTEVQQDDRIPPDLAQSEWQAFVQAVGA